MTRNRDENLPTHTVNVTTLPSRGLRERLVAAAGEREAVAEKADILSLDLLEVELEFKRWRRNGVSVTGVVRAKLTQECVVTLEPVASELLEEIDRIFLPEGSRLLRPQLNSEGELIVDHEGRDEPEAFFGDTLDAWEIALEHFMLGIDPFPRKPGATFEQTTENDEDKSDGDENSPFSALKDLVRR